MTETGTSLPAGASAGGLVPAARAEPAPVGDALPVGDAPPVGQSGRAREFAESRFRLSEVTRDERGMRITMRLGPWLDGPGGAATVGSLGVLVDSTIGMEVYDARPENSHSVTAELAVDVVIPPPWSGSQLTAHAELLGLDPVGGTARCEVRDDDGRLVVVGIGRCRFVSIPGASDAFFGEEPQMLAPAAHHSLLETLAAGETGGRAIAAPERAGDLGRFLLPANPAFENGGGTVHGGVLFCAAELAVEALADPAVPERTTAIRVNYLRPADLAAEVTATAELVHRGRTVSLYRVTTAGPSGKPATLATITRERGTPVF
ncbi:PaaI family thioesterase [Frankia sp. QA3]|uniref:PaaI family thioesterase n=1 Tax=Frankia sp. QA3 TaxID=710111 RepID=UPI000269BDAB|nr:PaaI family thioesterase [Frankia sp. QA3]EIV91827.1 hypothetical protein FraQA3DRAFT_1307 [Frankia sp. QA3]